jgi:hypothetical protein
VKPGDFKWEYLAPSYALFCGDRFMGFLDDHGGENYVWILRAKLHPLGSVSRVRYRGPLLDVQSRIELEVLAELL